MVRNLSATQVAVILLASAGIASAQSTLTLQRVSQSLDGVSYPNSNERYCHLPSSPCDREHRGTN